MTEASIEVVVLHLGIGLVVGPVIYVESVNRAHDSRPVTAARAMREEHTGGWVVDELQESINRVFLGIAGIAHRNVQITHPEGFDITPFVIGRMILQIDDGLDA